MDVHQNARLTPYCREWMVQKLLRGRPQAVVAGELGVSVRTVRKWVKRFQAEGPDGLVDRSSRPRSSPQATVRELGLAVLALRRQRLMLASCRAPPWLGSVPGPGSTGSPSSSRPRRCAAMSVPTVRSRQLYCRAAPGRTRRLPCVRFARGVGLDYYPAR